jgi:hypothetical protein
MKTPAELDAITSDPQAVLVHIDQIDFDQSIPLEDDLIALMDPSDMGYHDGNEIGGGETTLWLFGVDAEQLFKFIEPTLRNNPFSKNARITLRFGQFGSPEREFSL